LQYINVMMYYQGIETSEIKYTANNQKLSVANDISEFGIGYELIYKKSINNARRFGLIAGQSHYLSDIYKK
jgi:hypothetical protein